jgi:hypothetical protein
MQRSRAGLQRAFRAARYRVLGRPPIVLKPGQSSPLLRRWIRKAQADSAAMLTAWNPGAQQRSRAANRRAQQRLRRALRSLAPLALRPGRNEDPAGLWPAEPSLWVLGLKRPQLDRLAHAFGQRAYLYCGPSGRPRLRWI